MNLLFYTLATVTGFCAIGMLASAVLSRPSRVAARRLSDVIQSQPDAPTARPQSIEFREKLFKAIAWLRERFGMADNPNLVQRFERAGFFASTNRDLYLAARVMGPLVALLVASFISYKQSLWMMSLPGIAYLAPDLMLQRMVKRRQEKIRLSIPDAIDLLVICVDAGLGLDQAILRVAQELGKRHPDLQQELLRINREQRAGKLRIDAWQSMAARIRLPEIDAFVNMLMQTERFGTPIARALSNFGDGIREKRRQRAEELAAKTTVKILFPLVLCIFPSVFIVLLGPPGISIAHGFASSAP